MARDHGPLRTVVAAAALRDRRARVLGTRHGSPTAALLDLRGGHPTGGNTGALAPGIGNSTVPELQRGKVGEGQETRNEEDALRTAAKFQESAEADEGRVECHVAGSHRPRPGQVPGTKHGESPGGAREMRRYKSTPAIDDKGAEAALAARDLFPKSSTVATGSTVDVAGSDQEQQQQSWSPSLALRPSTPGPLGSLRSAMDSAGQGTSEGSADAESAKGGPRQMLAEQLLASSPGTPRPRSPRATPGAPGAPALGSSPLPRRRPTPRGRDARRAGSAVTASAAAVTAEAAVTPVAAVAPVTAARPNAEALCPATGPAWRRRQTPGGTAVVSARVHGPAASHATCQLSPRQRVSPTPVSPGSEASGTPRRRSALRPPAAAGRHTGSVISGGAGAGDGAATAAASPREAPRQGPRRAGGFLCAGLQVQSGSPRHAGGSFPACLPGAPGSPGASGGAGSPVAPGTPGAPGSLRCHDERDSAAALSPPALTLPRGLFLDAREASPQPTSALESCAPSRGTRGMGGDPRHAQRGARHVGLTGLSPAFPSSRSCSGSFNGGGHEPRADPKFRDLEVSGGQVGNLQLPSVSGQSRGPPGAAVEYCSEYPGASTNAAEEPLTCAMQGRQVPCAVSKGRPLAFPSSRSCTDSSAGASEALAWSQCRAPLGRIRAAARSPIVGRAAFPAHGGTPRVHPVLETQGQLREPKGTRGMPAFPGAQRFPLQVPHSHLVLEPFPVCGDGAAADATLGSRLRPVFPSSGSCGAVPDARESEAVGSGSLNQQARAPSSSFAPRKSLLRALHRSQSPLPPRPDHRVRSPSPLHPGLGGQSSATSSPDHRSIGQDPVPHGKAPVLARHQMHRMGPRHTPFRVVGPCVLLEVAVATVADPSSPSLSPSQSPSLSSALGRRPFPASLVYPKASSTGAVTSAGTEMVPLTARDAASVPATARSSPVVQRQREIAERARNAVRDTLEARFKAKGCCAAEQDYSGQVAHHQVHADEKRRHSATSTGEVGSTAAHGSSTVLCSHGAPLPEALARRLLAPSEAQDGSILEQMGCFSSDDECTVQQARVPPQGEHKAYRGGSSEQRGQAAYVEGEGHAKEPDSGGPAESERIGGEAEVPCLQLDMCVDVGEPVLVEQGQAPSISCPPAARQASAPEARVSFTSPVPETPRTVGAQKYPKVQPSDEAKGAAKAHSPRVGSERAEAAAYPCTMAEKRLLWLGSRNGSLSAAGHVEGQDGAGEGDDMEGSRGGGGEGGHGEERGDSEDAGKESGEEEETRGSEGEGEGNERECENGSTAENCIHGDREEMQGCDHQDTSEHSDEFKSGEDPQVRSLQGYLDSE